MSVVILTRFDAAAPFALDQLNANFQALAAALNSLAGERLVQLGTAAGNDGSGYVPEVGGTFLGQIKAPSILVGPAGETQHPVLTTDSAASEAVRGAVLQAAELAELTQSISSTPTQGQVEAIQAKLNSLIAALKAAGAMADGA